MKSALALALLAGVSCAHRPCLTADTLFSVPQLLEHYDMHRRCWLCEPSWCPKEIAPGIYVVLTQAGELVKRTKL